MSNASMRVGLGLCLLLSASPARGQEQQHQVPPSATGSEPPARATGERSYAAYVEAGGIAAFEGGAWTVNLERRLQAGTFLRVGAFYGVVDEEQTLLLPVLVNLLTTDPPHFFELGGGVLWKAIDVSRGVRPAFAVGYRYQRRPLFRIGVVFDPDDTAYPWPYAAVGFNF